MKPENVLVTTIGLHDYTPVSPVAPPNAAKEKDVIAIIKLADFGLARETKSKPPYTEYVSTRWYRAPEVLLMSRDYSNPVDMWALGTIMAELVNLKPLFPGSDYRDQINRICEIMGDPCNDYRDNHQYAIGGGLWTKGVQLAESHGLRFTPVRIFSPCEILIYDLTLLIRQIVPKDIHTFFERTVPASLIHCIRDLLKYDPDQRLTSRQCLEHPYLLEIYPRNHIPKPQDLVNGPLPQRQTATNSLPNQHRPPNPHIPIASSTHRVPYHPGVPHHSHSSQPHGTNVTSHQVHPMEITSLSVQTVSQPHAKSNAAGVPMGIDPPARTNFEPVNGRTNLQPSQNTQKSSKFGFIKPSKWLFGDRSSHLPPVEEIPGGIAKPSGRKRTQSSSTDKSVRVPTPPENDSRMNKKEAERLQLEAEKQRRELAMKSNREQARAVIQKRYQMMQRASRPDLEWQTANEQRVDFSKKKGKQTSSGSIRKNQGANSTIAASTSTTINASAGRFGSHNNDSLTVGDRSDWRSMAERVPKARRRDFDDDHSMSSSDVRSLSRMSSISFATVDSDPGPSRLRTRPSHFTISRMTSMSSLRTFDDFPTSARSSNSFSLEGQLVHDFRTQASMNSNGHLGSVSPPPVGTLSLSPTLSPSLSPSPTWTQPGQQQKDFSINQNNPYEYSVPSHPPSSYGHPPTSPYGHPPSSGHTPKSAKSVINPIFQVVSYKWDSVDGLIPNDNPGDPTQPPLSSSIGNHIPSSPNKLPPFSQLEAIAGGEYPPLSPMSFTTPSEETSSSSNT
jgi:meiosis induction protein kinase IME2/SME1